MLLSSHILSKGETVCDRVAILRAGRIFETGYLDALRGLVAVRPRARPPQPAPDLSAVPRVANVVVGGDTADCEDTGSMGALPQTLAASGFILLTIYEPSLVELFMA